MLVSFAVAASVAVFDRRAQRREAQTQQRKALLKLDDDRTAGKVEP
jgi:hypothetical protein